MEQGEETVLGEQIYADLASVPVPIDVVQIFRRPEAVPAIVDDAISVGARVVWMQAGIVNPQAADQPSCRIRRCHGSMYVCHPQTSVRFGWRLNSMFWILFLAHLIADYPLQTDWMVRAKRTWSGLTLHVTIHFVTMLVLVWPATRFIWPQLLALAGLHFAIDAFKNYLATHKPGWVVGPYFFDQFLHLVSIWMVATWIMSSPPPVSPLLPVSWAILSIGYLLATYVWYITERVTSTR